MKWANSFKDTNNSNLYLTEITPKAKRQEIEIKGI